MLLINLLNCSGRMTNEDSAVESKVKEERVINVEAVTESHKVNLKKMLDNNEIERMIDIWELISAKKSNKEAIKAFISVINEECVNHSVSGRKKGNILRILSKTNILDYMEVATKTLSEPYKFYMRNLLDCHNIEKITKLWENIREFSRDKKRNFIEILYREFMHSYLSPSFRIEMARMFIETGLLDVANDPFFVEQFARREFDGNLKEQLLSEIVFAIKNGLEGYHYIVRKNAEKTKDIFNESKYGKEYKI